VVDLANLSIVVMEIEVKKSKTMVLKSIFDSFLVLNEYANGQNPDKATAIVFDYQKKKIKWQKENFAISEINGSLLKAPNQHFENRFSYWDIESGSIIENPEENFSVPDNDLYFPQCYPENNEHFTWFVEVISRLTQHLACLSCEYLELKDKMVISYYYNEKDALNNSLIVLDNKGQIIESIKLGKNLNGIGKDTFFVIENRLIFISHKNTLNIYEI
jgi:hypothetical protein